jgi:hypothetical protein
MIALAQKIRKKRDHMAEMVQGIAKRRTNKKNIIKIEAEVKITKRIGREDKKKERDLDRIKKKLKNMLSNLKIDKNQKIKTKVDKRKNKKKDNVLKIRIEKDQEIKNTKIAEIVLGPKKTKREGQMIVLKKTTIVKTNTKDGEDKKMVIVSIALQRVEMKVKDLKILTTWID